MGAPEQNETQNSYIAHKTGCVVVAVDYRLPPEYPYPNGLEDYYSVLR